MSASSFLSLSLLPYLFLSLCITHTNTHTHTHTHTPYTFYLLHTYMNNPQTFYLCHTLSQTHTHTPYKFYLSLSLTHSLKHTHALTISYPLSLSPPQVLQEMALLLVCPFILLTSTAITGMDRGQLYGQIIWVSNFISTLFFNFFSYNLFSIVDIFSGQIICLRKLPVRKVSFNTLFLLFLLLDIPFCSVLSY